LTPTSGHGFRIKTNCGVLQSVVRSFTLRFTNIVPVLSHVGGEGEIKTSIFFKILTQFDVVSAKVLREFLIER